MSDYALPSTGGVVLAATGISQGLWWLVALAVVLVIAGAVLARLRPGRRSARARTVPDSVIARTAHGAPNGARPSALA